MERKCPHEAIVKQTHRELFGNGNQGLVKEFTELKTEFKEMNANVEKLATSYSALAQSQVKHDAVEKQKAENRKQTNSVIQRVGTIFAIVFGIVSTLYIILHFASSHG